MPELWASCGLHVRARSCAGLQAAPLLQENESGPQKYVEMKIMMMVKCLDCDANIEMVEPEIGQTLTCTACGRTYDIVWLYPVTLDWPEQPAKAQTPAVISSKVSLV